MSGWLSVFEFCHKNIKNTIRMAAFMQSLGMAGSLFRIELLLDIQKEMLATNDIQKARR